MDTRSSSRSVALWLLVCCAFVYAMIILGGVTRITGSGLSIVDWDPIMGAVPPLDRADWTTAFEKYRASPEYLQVNAGMSLESFKSIFWMEYLHRLVGRGIGLIFVLPLLYFLVRGRIGRRLAARLAFVFVLGALQGALGWYMVKSGLVRDPRVSQYRLTAHLAVALLIYGLLFWTSLDILFSGDANRQPERNAAGSGRFALAAAGLVSVTVLSGGFVAGIRAGHAYNTFPLMNGQWIPSKILAERPWYLNLFQNTATVQFNHRVLALTTLAVILVFFLRSRRRPLVTASRLLLMAVVAQVALGISTLLLEVPPVLAVAHQAGAVALFSVVVFVLHRRHGYRASRV